MQPEQSQEDPEKEENNELAESRKESGNTAEEVRKTRQENAETDKKGAETNKEPELDMSLNANQLVEVIPKCTDEKTVEQFVSVVDAIASKVTDKDLFLIVVKSKIRGKAFNAIKGKEVDTWEKIRSLLQNDLDEKADMATAMSKLTRITQKPDETLKDYIDRIKEALASLNKVAIREVSQESKTQVLSINNKSAQKTFESGMRNQALRTVVIAAQRSSFIESYTFALDQESTNFPSRASIPNRNDRNDRNGNVNNNSNGNGMRKLKCFNCNKLGHISKNCWSKRKPPINGNNGSSSENNIGKPTYDKNQSFRPNKKFGNSRSSYNNNYSNNYNNVNSNRSNGNYTGFRNQNPTENASGAQRPVDRNNNFRAVEWEEITPVSSEVEQSGNLD